MLGGICIKNNSLNFREIVTKSVFMLIGIFLSSLGVSLSLRSNLGATPIGVCPAVFSGPLNISIGTATGILLALFFVVQIVLLKKDFPPLQIFQFVATIIYSFSVDFTTYLLSFFPNELIWQRVIYLALGIFILAFGVFIMLKTNFVMLPQDAVVKVICMKYNKKYGKVKIISDSILTVIGLIGSLIIYNKLVHVGIGTILAAIFVGKIITKLEQTEPLNRSLDGALAQT